MLRCIWKYFKISQIRKSISIHIVIIHFLDNTFQFMHIIIHLYHQILHLHLPLPVLLQYLAQIKIMEIVAVFGGLLLLLLVVFLLLVLLHLLSTKKRKQQRAKLINYFLCRNKNRNQLRLISDLITFVKY